jgi:hypothetical protein
MTLLAKSGALTAVVSLIVGLFGAFSWTFCMSFSPIPTTQRGRFVTSCSPFLPLLVDNATRSAIKQNLCVGLAQAQHDHVPGLIDESHSPRKPESPPFQILQVRTIYPKLCVTQIESANDFRLLLSGVTRM